MMVQLLPNNIHKFLHDLLDESNLKKTKKKQKRVKKKSEFSIQQVFCFFCKPEIAAPIIPEPPVPAIPASPAKT